MTGRNGYDFVTTRRQLMRLTAVAAGSMIAGPLVQPLVAEARAAQAATNGGTLKIGIRNYDYDTLDPHQTSFTQVYYMIMNIVDPLVWLAPDLSYQPGLATSWAPSADAKEWTFKLRPDVLFHDGTKFDANAVKFNLDRMVDPATKSRQAGPLLGPYDHTEVVDDTTVKVLFKEPYAVALNAFSSHFCGMVSPTAVKKYGQAFAQHVTGTGPFVFEKEDPHVLVTMKKYPSYNWAPPFQKHQGPAFLDAIQFKFIPEDGTRLTALQTGEADIIDEIPVDQVANLKGNPDFAVASVPKPGVARGYHLNTQKAPTNELPVRQAMEYAVDRSTLDKVVFKGIYPVARNVLTANTRFYDASLENLYPYDPAKAKQLLDNAGWKVGSGGTREKNGQKLKVVLATFSGYVAEIPSQLVQSQYKDVGIEFDINVMTGAAMMQGGGQKVSPYNTVLSGDYDVDPGKLMYSFFDSAAVGTTNYAHFSDQHLDQLIEQGLATADPNARKTIYDEIQKIVMDNALVVPLYANVSLFGSRAAVTALRFDPRANPLLYDVQLKGK